MTIKASSILLALLFLLLLAFLYASKDYLLAAHLDESAIYFSSDAPVYYESYEKTYQSVDIFEIWQVFLRASPILMMIITNGDLFAIQLFNLAVMFVVMWCAFSCLDTFPGRMFFLLSSIIFPYYILGFMSLNKEVYAMAAAIMYGCYILRGRFLHLLLALILALLARYYMMFAFLMLMVVIPRRRKVRWLLILGALVAVSVLAPVAASVVPQYSSEGLLDGSGATSALFDSIVKNYGYALLYPFKYILLPLVRPYGYLVGSTHDAIGAIVSVLSLIAIFGSVWLIQSWQDLSHAVRRLVVAGFVAPIPLMWSEIMHWRYYSFVYFFFVFALVKHVEDGERGATRAKPHPQRGLPAGASGLALAGGPRR